MKVSGQLPMNPIIKWLSQVHTQKLNPRSSVNGNASAGANLATSSYANQSKSTTANAFMQAFSGGLPEPEGELVITGISGTQANGYTVEGTRTTTTNHSTTYTVDGDGAVTNQVNN